MIYNRIITNNRMYKGYFPLKKHIILPYIGDIRIKEIFHDVEKITVWGTEKNFMYYYLNKHYFPNAKTLYYTGYLGGLIYQIPLQDFYEINFIKCGATEYYFSK
jgi:hypothetical protein